MDRHPARHVWVMDRGIPTEPTLEWMRENDTAYLVGTPKRRLNRYEERFPGKSWQEVCGDVRVKPIEEDGEVYVLAQSGARQAKESGMRMRKLKKLRDTLVNIKGHTIRDTATCDKLLMKLGAAKKAAGLTYNIIVVEVPEPGRTSLGSGGRGPRCSWTTAPRRLSSANGSAG